MLMSRKKKKKKMFSLWSGKYGLQHLSQNCPMGTVTTHPHYNYKENIDEEI